MNYKYTIISCAKAAPSLVSAARTPPLGGAGGGVAGEVDSRMDGPWIELGLFCFFGTIALGLAYAWLVVVPKEREEKRALYLARLARHRAAWAEEQEKKAQATEYVNRRKEHVNRRKEKASAAAKRAEEAAARAAARLAAVEEHEKNVAQKAELRKQQMAQRSRSATDESPS